MTVSAGVDMAQLAAMEESLLESGMSGGFGAPPSVADIAPPPERLKDSMMYLDVESGSFRVVPPAVYFPDGSTVVPDDPGNLKSGSTYFCHIWDKDEEHYAEITDSSGCSEPEPDWSMSVYLCKVGTDDEIGEQYHIGSIIVGGAGGAGGAGHPPRPFDLEGTETETETTDADGNVTKEKVASLSVTNLHFTLDGEDKTATASSGLVPGDELWLRVSWEDTGSTYKYNDAEVVNSSEEPERESDSDKKMKYGFYKLYDTVDEPELVGEDYRDALVTVVTPEYPKPPRPFDLSYDENGSLTVVNRHFVMDGEQMDAELGTIASNEKIVLLVTRDTAKSGDDPGTMKDPKAIVCSESSAESSSESSSESAVRIVVPLYNVGSDGEVKEDYRDASIELVTPSVPDGTTVWYSSDGKLQLYGASNCNDETYQSGSSLSDDLGGDTENTGEMLVVLDTDTKTVKYKSIGLLKGGGGGEGGEITVITDIQYENGYIQVKTRKVKVVSAEDESGWDNKISTIAHSDAYPEGN